MVIEYIVQRIDLMPTQSLNLRWVAIQLSRLLPTMLI